MKERAAGGVVYRRGENGFEILMIRDRYGKWALPKGKLEAGESWEEAGLREIYEETGIRGEILSALHHIYYRYDHPVKGSVDKEVVYYLVRALNEELVPQAGEVEAANWVGLKESFSLSEYENNREVLVKAIEILSKEL